MKKLLRVLIIDDSEDDTMLLLRELHRGGYDISHKRVNTQETMSYALLKQTWDIIIADNIMPHFSGLDALKLLQKSGLDLPFIIVSDKIGENIAIEDMKAGAQDYIIKSNLSRLVPAIERELRYVVARQEHKHTEENIKKSEERYRQLVEHLPHIIYSFSTTRGGIYYSPQVENILGYSIDHFYKNPFLWNKLIHKDDIQNVLTVIDEFINGRRSDIEYRIKDKNDNWHWFHDYQFDKHYECDDVIVDGIASDITERKCTEENIKKSEALLEETQRLTKVGGWEYDIEKRNMTWTNEVYDIYDVKKDHDVNNIDRNIVFYAPENRHAIEQAFYSAVNDGKPYDLELQFNSAKGRHLWVRVIGKPVIDNKKITRIVGNIMDITNRKISENALRDNEEKFRALVENILDIVARFDNQYRHLYINPITTQFLGKNPEYFIGKSHRELGFPEKDVQCWESAIQKVFNTGKSHQSELELDTTCGIKYFDWRIFPEFDEDKKVKTVVTLSRDITERKNAEKKLKIAYENLERLNRELEQFTYVAYHDLQEPLRMVHSFSELLEKNYKGKLGTDADEFIGYITTGAKRMQQMINDVLALSLVGRKGKEFKQTNVERILKIVLENLHSLIDENHAIVTYDPLPTIIADDSQINQLFQNLIDNAIKFCREKTPEIHISCTRKNGEYMFSVKDNGIGIDKNQFKKLFIIFQRLHNREEYTGTGIGLAVCKKIVERHEGKIWVESEVGIGSTFYFTIPERSTNDNKIN